LSGEWQVLLDLSTVPWSGTPDIAFDKDQRELWLYRAPLQDVQSPRKALELWRLDLAGDANETHPSSLQPLQEIPLPTHLLPLVDGGRLWFLADDAVVAYQPGSGTWHTYPVRSRAGYLGTAAQQPGSLWFLSGDETLVHFDTHGHSLTMQPIPYGQGWSRIEVLTETVWLAGDSNVLLSTSHDLRNWEQHLLPSECIGHSVLAMAGAGRVLWVAGEDGVIRLETDTQEKSCLTEAEGMLVDTATQLIADPTGVWFSHSGYGLWGYTTVRTDGP
jgi:streptogramin lyase